jgi:hypothetical protein
MLTFGIVAFTSVGQIWCVALPTRRIFFLATAAIAIVAGVLTAMALTPASGTTPLHVALKEYAHLYGVGVIRWADVNNALRGAGLVLLVAGSVATFWVKVSTAEELREQLRGFKSLFNAGAIFLMIGTFEVFAGFRWPIVFAGDEAARTALQDAAAAFATTVGAGFAVVMLATYITTTAVLRQQAIAHGVPRADVAAELETAGFSDLISQQVLRFAQALAPLIPGVFTVLLS